LHAKYRWSSAKGELYDRFCGETNLKYHGRFHKWKPPQKTMFFDPDLQDLVPKETLSYVPADMSDFAFYKGLAKFGKKTPDTYNRAAFRAAVRMMRKHFRCLRGSKLSSVSDVVAAMKLDTSAGPALKTLYPSKGDAMADGRFWEFYAQFQSAMKCTGGTRTYWGACSKQELREKEKVAEGKTRVFMSGSLFMYIFMQVYCKDFNDKFYESVFDTASCVGMSKFSGGFDYVYSRLLFPKNCGSLDASGWDTCMLHAMMWAIAQFRFDCIDVAPGEELDVAIAMCNIYHQVTESFIFTPAGEVCQKVQGNPSGSSNTIVDNTIGHYILKAYDWVVLRYESPCEEDWEDYYDDFSANVSLLLFGDDDMFSVSDESKDLYNPTTIIKASAELGFVLTTEQELLSHSVNLSFLSHAVRPDRNGYLVPYLPLVRLCCAALYSQSSSVLIRAQRLSNLRYEGYYTPGWLPIIDSMISKFKCLHADPEVLEVFSHQLSNREIETLYVPIENAGPNKSIPRVLKMKIDDFEFVSFNYLYIQPHVWKAFQSSEYPTGEKRGQKPQTQSKEEKTESSTASGRPKNSRSRSPTSNEDGRYKFQRCSDTAVLDGSNE